MEKFTQQLETLYEHMQGKTSSVSEPLTTPTIPTLLQKASSTYQAGNLVETRLLYQQVLSQHPDHFLALQGLAVIAYREKNYPEALPYIQQALRINAQAHTAAYMLGLIYQGLNQHELAVTAFETSLALNKNYAVALNSQGMSLRSLGQLEQAIVCYQKAISLQADYMDAHYNCGNAYHALKDLFAALECYQKAIRLAPQRVEIYNNLGNVYVDMREYDKAIQAFNQVIARDANYAIAYANRSVAWRSLQKHEQAIADCTQAITLRPDYAEAYNMRGIAWQELGDQTQALADFSQALMLDPNHVDAHNNLGISFKQKKAYRKALESYQKAIALDANYPNAQWNLGLLYLMQGDFERGWQQYEWRWKSSLQGEYRTYPQPLWLGKPSLRGKTLFVYSEQGLGDTLQFCRYLNLVADLGAKVILEVPSHLAVLMQGLHSKPRVILTGATPPSFDYYCPLLSLPLAFQTMLESVPASVPYLFADKQKSHVWGSRLGKAHRPRIGLVWHGGFRANQPELWGVNSRRNMSFSYMAKLQALNADFYSLQKGEPAESELLQSKSQYWTQSNFHILTAYIHDFSDTAQSYRQFRLSD